MSKKKNKAKKQPTAATPGPSEPRSLGVPDFRSQQFVYCLKTLDHDGPWGWNNLRLHWPVVVDKLDQLQTMKWGGVLLASGGRESGTNSHALSVEQLNPIAQKRLQEIERDDVEIVYSVRLAAKQRLYGTRTENFFHILWFDIDHDDNDTCVCRSRKK